MVTIPTKGCHFDPRGCVLRPEHEAQVWAVPNPGGFDTGWRIDCGHCGQAFYDAAVTLVNHTFRCDGQRLIVIARDMGAVVHHCAQDVDQMVEAASLLLLAQEVGAASST